GPADPVLAGAAVVVPARAAGLEHDDEVVALVREVREDLVRAAVAAHEARRLDLEPRVVLIARRVQDLISVVGPTAGAHEAEDEDGEDGAGGAGGEHGGDATPPARAVQPESS